MSTPQPFETEITQLKSKGMCPARCPVGELLAQSPGRSPSPTAQQWCIRAGNAPPCCSRLSSLCVYPRKSNSLFNTPERITDKSFFAPYCKSMWQPCFFSYCKHVLYFSSEPFGCWYKIHNGCQNLQFFLLFYEVRQYYLHWCIPFSQLKTFSFEHDRLKESWFCNLACETQYEGAGG